MNILDFDGGGLTDMPGRITWLLFIGIGVVLIVATLVGSMLRRRFGAQHLVVTNLNTRIKAWWIVVAVTGVAILMGRTGVIVLFGLVSFFALREFITLAPTQRGDHLPLATGFFIVLPLQYIFVWHKWFSMMSLFIPVYAFLALPILTCLGQDSTRVIDRAAQTQWGLMICVYCISHLPALLIVDIPDFEGRNLLLLIFLIVIVQFGDLMQYVCGKLFGHHHIAAGLSSYRTIEGLVGGVICATILGACLWWITPFTMPQATVVAFVIAITGCFGGLVMSAIKRDRGVRDWGNTIEGHGGMLDRFDSVCFAAPVLFHIVRYLA